MGFSMFFSNLQETSWYRAFLNPVIDEIGAEGKLLDIGTGSGKLIQILSSEKGVNCTGVDTSEEMLEEAGIKLKGTNVSLLKIEPNEKLPFNDSSFNYITICNVLFHLSKESIDFLLKEAQRVLQKGGKIIVLTPSGKGNILKLSKNYFSMGNSSIYIWYYATKNRARLWSKGQYLKQYSIENELDYQSTSTMHGFAQLEIIKN